MLDRNDKRNFIRMDIECPASFTVEGGDGNVGAIVKNLSGGGVLMWLEQPVEPDTVLFVELRPPSSITPPMKARMKVLRCNPVEEAERQFAVACMTVQVID